MRPHNGYLSRGELIAGLIATGTLAACGHGAPAGPPPPSVPGPCSSTSSKKVGADKIFSDPVFANLDKAGLESTFDISSQIEALHQGYFSQTGQQAQSSTVIRSIPNGGIVIKTPGTYTFGNDIQWNPNDVLGSAITIACSNVTLDLAGFTLSASILNKSRQMTGVLVFGTDAAPLSGVTIENGTIQGLTEYGILASGTIGLSITGITVSGICLQNLATRFLTPSGIHVCDSVSPSLTNCNVTDMSVRTDSCAGISLIATEPATVSNCNTIGLVNWDGAVQGFSYIQCIGIATSGCKAQSLQSHFNGNVLTTGHTVLGFCPIFCLTLSYVDCSASGLTGCCDDCHGMSVFLDGVVSVDNFHADNVVDGVSPSNSGAKATGLEVYGALVTVTNSTVSNIKAINPQDKQATGFSAWGAGITFDTCTATNVTVQEDFGSGSHAEGFGWAPDPRDLFCYIGAYYVTYKNCIADGCQVGFDTWYHVDSTWTNPTFTNCATGSLVEPGAKRTLSCDPCSECNGGIVVTLANIASGNTYPPI